MFRENFEKNYVIHKDNGIPWCTIVGGRVSYPVCLADYYVARGVRTPKLNLYSLLTVRFEIQWTQTVLMIEDDVHVKVFCFLLRSTSKRRIHNRVVLCVPNGVRKTNKFIIHVPWMSTVASYTVTIIGGNGNEWNMGIFRLLIHRVRYHRRHPSRY